MQTVDWGLNMMTTGAQALREAERKAKQGRVAMWQGYVPRANAPPKLQGDFTGTVTEVRLRLAASPPPLPPNLVAHLSECCSTGRGRASRRPKVRSKLERPQGGRVTAQEREVAAGPLLWCFAPKASKRRILRAGLCWCRLSAGTTWW